MRDAILRDLRDVAPYAPGARNVVRRDRVAGRGDGRQRHGIQLRERAAGAHAVGVGSAAPRGGRVYRSEDDAAYRVLRRRLRSVPRVARVVCGSVAALTRLVSRQRPRVTSDIAAGGVTSAYRNVLGMRVVAGHFVSGGERPVRPGDQPHEAVISERLVGAGVRQRSTGRW